MVTILDCVRSKVRKHYSNANVRLFTATSPLFYSDGDGCGKADITQRDHVAGALEAMEKEGLLTATASLRCGKGHPLIGNLTREQAYFRLRDGVSCERCPIPKTDFAWDAYVAACSVQVSFEITPAFAAACEPAPGVVTCRMLNEAMPRFSASTPVTEIPEVMALLNKVPRARPKQPFPHYTVSGSEVWYEEPDRTPFRLSDFFVPLSRSYRYGAVYGISALQHTALCVALAHLYGIPPAEPAAHDLHEGVLLDMPSPMKLMLPDYSAIERPWELWVHRHLGLTPWLGTTKRVDVRAASVEMRIVKHPNESTQHAYSGGEPTPEELDCWFNHVAGWSDEALWGKTMAALPQDAVKAFGGWDIPRSATRLGRLSPESM